MSNSSIEGKLKGLQERFENEMRIQPGGVQRRRPPPMFPSSIHTFPTRSPQVTETESRMREVKEVSGKLNVGGREYLSNIDELQQLGELGSGTCGHVVKMLHKPSAAVIAVKQMRRSGNCEETKRILMDLDVVVRSHDCPYIVRCLGCFVTDADVWICMELMALCFDKLLKRLKAPIPEEILGKVTVATVNALSYLKDTHGVIHRDVKPSNILLDERGNVKLCDFGISGRLVDSKAKTRSAGCAAYMAPERIDPPDPTRPDYDIRADVWSLGISLVELATGVFPYRDCTNDFEVLTRVIADDPPQLPNDSNFTPEFKSFVTQCLTKNYRQRPKYAKLLEHPFVVKSTRNNISVGDWYAQLPGSSPSVSRPAGSAVATHGGHPANGVEHPRNFVTSTQHEPVRNFVTGSHEPGRNFAKSSQHEPVRNFATSAQHEPARNFITSAQHEPARNFVTSAQHEPVRNFVTSAQHEPARNFVTSAQHEPVRNFVTSAQHEPVRNFVTSAQHEPVRNFVTSAQHEPVRNFVTSAQHEPVRNYATSAHHFEPVRNFVTSAQHWLPEQVTPTPGRTRWGSGSSAGGSSSQPTSLETEWATHSPYPRRRTIDAGAEPPPPPARRVSDTRWRPSPASSGNTSPIVLQRFYHQQQRRSRVDLHATPRHRSLSREHSAGRSPEPPPRTHRQHHMLGHEANGSMEFESPPSLHDRLHPHPPSPLLLNDRLSEGRSQSLTRAEVRNGYRAEPPAAPRPHKHRHDDQGWLHSLAGLVKRRLSGYVKWHHVAAHSPRHHPPVGHATAAAARWGASESWSVPASPLPPRAPPSRPAD